MISQANNFGIVVMCKRPALGLGKQRIAIDLGRGIAFNIAQQLVMCSVEDVQTWPGKKFVAVAEPKDTDWARSVFGVDVTVLDQSQGNLGERINDIDEKIRKIYDMPLIFMGTDAPNLNLSHVEEAQNELLSHDVVLSRADDGGVTIMASRGQWPDLREIAWSTNTVSRELASLCIERSLSTTFITPSFDIDTVADLQKAYTALISDPRPSRIKLREIIKASMPLMETKYV